MIEFISVLSNQLPESQSFSQEFSAFLLTVSPFATIIMVFASALYQTKANQKGIEDVKEDNQASEKRINKKIDELEKKQEKYNNIQERIATEEARGKSMHKRMDEQKGNCTNVSSALAKKLDKIYDVLIQKTID